MPAAKTVQVTALMEREFDHVCILLPYGNRVNGTSPEIDAINHFLEKTGYIGDEDQWALAWHDRGRVSLTVFDRESDLDVIGGEQLRSLDALPDTLKEVQCARAGQAHIFKILKDRSYFVLAESDA